ncbi:hypothetical protein JMJ56_12265 [Belnapia sp. T18]|uniref:Uncharacterized protein n=1 Tax=Belnapia arida TaxID=2804533 RepID=A0ABS1U266_9PROT|nr:hypothetical protein [Belnapia arida]MBL6078784.1 hypothetical protein [Belnapia arida]
MSRSPGGKDAGSPGGAARPAPKPRASRAGRPVGRPAAPRAARAPVPDSPLAGWRRWLWVGVLVFAVLIGLPLAHALFGEVVALLGGTLLLGVLLGRWTAPRR